VQKIFKKIIEIYEDQKGLLEKYNESQLEDNFIKPIFTELGHFFVIREKTDKSARRPDYAFFPTEEEKRNAIKNKGNVDFYKTAIAIGDAKQLDRSLDKKIKGKDTFEFPNPSFQIDTYLRETKPKWGILTNGRKWRIYYKETSYKLDSYYEIDLINIIENKNLNDFKYFYFFFRREAFIEDSTGKCFPDKVFDQSIKYAEDIGENLEESVYKALKWMAEGFFSLKSNNLSKDEQTIKIIHENSLIFLYRLLFVLYANSRGILKPPKDRRYDPYNIEALIEDIIYKLDRNEVPHGAWYWTRLEEIFLLVNQGSVARNIPKEEFFVPAYNGGLFDPAKYPFLKEKKINDEYIAKVIDLLVRTKSKDHEGLARVDYSDLSIRHLGGIYEGLLEYKLRVAQEDLVAIKKKGKLVWIPKSKKGNDKIYDEVRKEEIYLTTDKNERKVTGSYFTPDYIVKYIVKNTLEPVIEEKIKKSKNNEEIRNAILSIKVLDPAMGSGHFLVEATDFLAQKLSLYLEFENGKETDIEWAKREIVKRCIYGVDLNPLATELAKVSLWLNAISKDKPLSFLDHHLRTGNSLIGADIKKLGTHQDREIANKNNLMRFFGKDFNKKIDDLLNLYKNIMKIRGEDVDDIRKQEEIYHELRNNPFRLRFEELANLYVSYYFGNKFSSEDYEKVLSEFKIGGNWNEIKKLEIFKRAQKIAEEEKFFHWELEFLEVFFDMQSGEKENSGFDLVIGNPPWGARLNFEVVNNLLVSGVRRHSNTYTFFSEKGINLVKKGGFFGFIIPNTWIEIDSCEKFRRLVFSVAKDINIVLTWKIFPETHSKAPVVDTCILYFKKDNAPNKFLIKNEKYEEIEITKDYNIKAKVLDRNLSIQERLNSLNLRNWINEIYYKTLDIWNNFKAKLSIFEEGRGGIVSKQIIHQIDIKSNFLEKDSIAKVRIGTQEYAEGGGDPPQTRNMIDNKVYNATEKKDNDYKPFVPCADIERYVLEWSGQWLKYGKNLHCPRDIKIYKEDHLLLGRIFDKKSGRFKCCFVPGRDEFFVNNTDSFNILIENKDYTLYSLLGIINSRLIGFYTLESNINLKRMAYPKINTKHAKRIPIPKKNYKPYLDKVDNLSQQICKNKEIFKEESNSFFKWFSREWDVNLESLNLKDELKEYWKYDFKEIIKIVKRNKSKIKGNSFSRDFQETLEKEWKRSINKLNPLLKEIQEIENYIDAIVFKIYGLKEEEVKIVLDSSDTKNEIENDILKKFRELK
jgi:hypothetical protein